ncbi:MAG: hypothetical protein WBO70_08230, partial [Erysipelotrichaceae bacterium]
MSEWLQRSCKDNYHKLLEIKDKFPNLDEDILLYLISHNIDTVDMINDFFNSDLNNIPNFTLLENGQQLIDNIINNKDKVFYLYGDYDCDGVCALSIMYLSLKPLVPNLNIYYNDRIIDGYGLKQRGIDFIN